MNVGVKVQINQNYSILSFTVGTKSKSKGWPRKYRICSLHTHKEWIFFSYFQSKQTNKEIKSTNKEKNKNAIMIKEINNIIKSKKQNSNAESKSQKQCWEK